MDLIRFKNGARVAADVLELAGGHIQFAEPGGVLRSASLQQVEGISFRRPLRSEESNPLREGAVGALNFADTFEIRGSLGRICETEEEKAELAAWIRRIFDRPVQSVLLTRNWGHPIDQSVAAVRFRPRKLHGVYYLGGTALISNRNLLPKRAQWEESVRMNWGPEEGDSVFGDWFTDGKINEYLLVQYQVGRSRHLYLPAQNGDASSYEDISKLLRLLDEKKIGVRNDNEDLRPFLPFIDVDKIISVRANVEGGVLRYDVKTGDGGLTGGVYVFEKEGDGFVMVGMGLWMS